MAQIDGSTEPIQRRTWLKIVSTGTLSALAGCSGGSDNQNTSANSSNPFGEGTTSQSDSQNSNLADPEFTTVIKVIPTDQNFNPWAASAVFNIDGQYLNYSWPALYFPDGSVKGILAKDWKVKGDSGSITLKDGITWHNGKDIKARDYVIGRKISKLVTGAEEPMFTDFKAANDKTVEFSIAQEASAQILKLDLFRRHTSTMIRTPRFVYEKHLENLQKAKEEGEDAFKEAVGKFTKKNITSKVGSGPLKIKNISEQSMSFEPHDGHPGGKQLNFNTLKMKYVESDQQQAQGMINDNFDGLKQASSDKRVLNKYPDSAKLSPKPTYSGMGLIINNASKPFDDPRVRQAIGHAIDPTKIVNRFNKVAYHPKESYYSGSSKFSIKDWVGNSLGEKFTDYTGKNTGKAASLLKDAGFTKSGGNWQTPSGEQFTVTIKNPNASEQTFANRSVSQDLTQFGIKAEAKSMEKTTAFGQFKNGDYQLGVWGYAALNTAHPYFDYWTTYAPDGWWSGVCSIPEELSVPPLGQPDDSRQSMNVVDLVKQSKRGDKKAMQKLAWSFNQALPIVPLMEKGANSVITTDHWEYPNKSPVMGVMPPHLVLPQFGTLKAKTK